MIVYLHGFASGPDSAKARYFRAHFRGQGMEFVAPDCNAPEFSALSLSRIVATAQTAARQAPSPAAVVAIGSSLGGYAAALWAQRERLRALVLIAPAFELSSLWRRRLGEARLEAWRRSGSVELRDEAGHWVYGPQFPRIGFELFADAERHDQTPLALSLPVLLFHGGRDAEVPVAVSERFCALNPHVEFVRYAEDGHSLSERLEDMATRTSRFLAGLPPPDGAAGGGAP